MRSARHFILLASLALFLTGCKTEITIPQPRPTTTHLHLTHHTGGTHHRVLVHDGRWIQAFGCSVQVVDPQSLMVIHDVPLGEFGKTGPVIDLARVGDRLLAVIEDDAVVELSLDTGIAPRIVRTTDAAALGILPRTLTALGETCYVAGVGGVVDLSTGQRIFIPESASGVCGHVARAGSDLVVPVGRRVYRMSDGQYLGAATDLLTFDPLATTSSNDPASPPLAFILQSRDNALAGLMTADIREVPGDNSRVVIEREARRIGWFNDRLWFVGTLGIAAYAIEGKGDTLRLERTIDMLGARDVAPLDEHRIAIVGTAGRAVYQFNERGAEGRFIAAERDAGRLTHAAGDGLNLLAGSDEGTWTYLVNARAELTTRTPPSSISGPRTASVVSARAQISDDGLTLHVTPTATATPAPSASEDDDDSERAPPAPAPQPWQYREDKNARLHTVIAVNNQFWVGHDRGITILWPNGSAPAPIDPETGEPLAAVAPADPVVERLRIPGPVRYLFPLMVGKGASYVSEFGGFGVARFIDEAIE
jgi:hypothetical protein